MHDPISVLFARDMSGTLALSARPESPRVPLRPTRRRRRTLQRLRRGALSI